MKIETKQETVNKDIVIENKDKKVLEDIEDIVCDERNGNLIIVIKK